MVGVVAVVVVEVGRREVARRRRHVCRGSGRGEEGLERGGDGAQVAQDAAPRRSSGGGARQRERRCDLRCAPRHHAVRIATAALSVAFSSLALLLLLLLRQLLAVVVAVVQRSLSFCSHFVLDVRKRR